MFRVLGFWTLVMGLMALAGQMMVIALLLFLQTVVFAVLGYMNLTERSYMLLFWSYMLIAFLGISLWTFFGSSI